jgi:hypothetical protein
MNSRKASELQLPFDLGVAHGLRVHSQRLLKWALLVGFNLVGLALFYVATSYSAVAVCCISVVIVFVLLVAFAQMVGVTTALSFWPPRLELTKSAREDRGEAALAPLPATPESPLVEPVRPPRRTVWKFLLPTAALAATAAAAVLLVFYFRQDNVIARQQQELADARQEAGRSLERMRALEREASDLRDRLAHAATMTPDRLPRRPEDGNATSTGLALVEATPSVSFGTVTLGPSPTQSQVLTATAPLPSVRLPLVLGRVRQGAKIDAKISGIDPPIERQDLTSEGSGPERHASLVLQPEEVRRLLNRQVQLTLTDRGYANLGTVNITITLR